MPDPEHRPQPPPGPEGGPHPTGVERQADQEHEEELQRERWELLEHVHGFLERPMVALAFVWLVLVVIDLTQGLTPALAAATWGIWIVFLVNFLIEFIIAPHKLDYLRTNWLTALSLALPALRFLRVLRALRALRFLRLARTARSASLVRVVATANRSLRAARQTLGKRRALGYVIATVFIVLFVGSAGMWYFENPASLREAGVPDVGPRDGLGSYTEAIWWTSMILTTLGSEYWPKTAEGRALGWIIAIFSLTVFGYITANIASYFVGKDIAGTGSDDEPPKDLTTLTTEIDALRDQVARLTALLEDRTLSTESPAGRPPAQREVLLRAEPPEQAGDEPPAV